MKKKKRIHEEVRDPNEEINKDMSSSINKTLDKYMLRMGWNDEDMRTRFSEIISTFLISGKGSNKQRLIVSYLEKGLQVLNLEMSKEKISTEQPDDPDVQGDKVFEAFNNIRKLKNKLYESKRNLVCRNYSLDEAKKISLQYFKQNGRSLRSLDNLKSINEQEADNEKKDVYLTNFKTFLRLYLTRDYNWATETVNGVTDIMIEMVEKVAGDANKQTTLNRRIEDLQKSIGTTMTLNKQPEDSKNLEVSMSEFRKYAVSLNGWSGKIFTPFFNNLILLFVNSKNVNIQRILVNKLSEINSTLPSKTENNNKTEKQEGGDE